MRSAISAILIVACPLAAAFAGAATRQARITLFYDGFMSHRLHGSHC